MGKDEHQSKKAKKRNNIVPYTKKTGTVKHKSPITLFGGLRPIYGNATFPLRLDEYSVYHEKACQFWAAGPQTRTTEGHGMHTFVADGRIKAVIYRKVCNYAGKDSQFRIERVILALSRISIDEMVMNMTPSTLNRLLTFVKDNPNASEFDIPTTTYTNGNNRQCSDLLKFEHMAHQDIDKETYYRLTSAATGHSLINVPLDFFKFLAEEISGLEIYKWRREWSKLAVDKEVMKSCCQIEKLAHYVAAVLILCEKICETTGYNCSNRHKREYYEKLFKHNTQLRQNNWSSDLHHIRKKLCSCVMEETVLQLLCLEVNKRWDFEVHHERFMMMDFDPETTSQFIQILLPVIFLSDYNPKDHNSVSNFFKELLESMLIDSNTCLTLSCKTS